MKSRILNRIERVQEAHPWMKEADISKLLVAKYFLLSRVEKLKSSEAQAAMEEFTNELVMTDKEVMQGALAFVNRK